MVTENLVFCNHHEKYCETVRWCQNEDDYPTTTEIKEMRMVENYYELTLTGSKEDLEKITLNLIGSNVDIGEGIIERCECCGNNTDDCTSEGN